MMQTTAPAAPFAVVVYKKGDSSRVMLAGGYETAEAAHSRANTIRRGTDAALIVAPVTRAFVEARLVVAAF